jgi:hypothetical protein
MNMKNENNQTVGTVPQSKRRIAKRSKIYIPSTNTDCSLFWLGTGTSIKKIVTGLS